MASRVNRRRNLLRTEAKTTIDVSFLITPLGLILQLCGAGAIAIVLAMHRPDPFSKKRTQKLGRIWIAERVKPGEWKYDFNAKLTKTKDKQVNLVASDKREFILPEEKKDEFERIIDMKTGRFARMFALESGQIVKWSAELAKQANPLLDHTTVTQYNNRTSARRLATAQFAGSNQWIMLALGAAAGLAIAWIAYPMVVHQTPIIVTCTQLANGTIVPRNVYCP